MRLVSVYEVPAGIHILYALLSQRRKEQNISHKVMPRFSEHKAFFDSRPYEAWYLLDADGEYVGSAYLTQAREIGVFIFDKYKGQNYGAQAVCSMIAAHPGKMLANVNPHNDPSIKMFETLGFKCIQQTYVNE